MRACGRRCSSRRRCAALGGAGHRSFIEVSPHPVLAAAVTETLDGAAAFAGGAAPFVTGTLRRDDGGPARLLASLAGAHVHGVPVDWAAVLPAGQRVDLPTYAFQRQRYWPRPAAALAGDVRSAGLGAVEHPLLGAAVELAGGDGLVLTGRVSLAAQPWLADHAVADTVLLPGTAFVELAIRAGDAAGCGQMDELALEAPLRAARRRRGPNAGDRRPAGRRRPARAGHICSDGRRRPGRVDAARQRVAGWCRRG